MLIAKNVSAYSRHVIRPSPYSCATLTRTLFL